MLLVLIDGEAAYRIAAVHAERGAGDVAGLRRAQVEDGVGDIGLSGAAPERDLAQGRLDMSGGQRTGGTARRETGLDRVDADAEFRELQSEPLREAVERGLGDAVGRHGPAHLARRARGDVDDRAGPPGRDHLPGETPR